MIRFRRTFKLFPGVKLHVGKHGVGLSFGRRGFHVGVRNDGTRYVSCGIPGSGIYAMQELGKK